jgi:hypothetical protein
MPATARKPAKAGSHQQQERHYLLLQLFISPNGGPTGFLGFFKTIYSTVTKFEIAIINPSKSTSNCRDTSKSRGTRLCREPAKQKEQQPEHM